MDPKKEEMMDLYTGWRQGEFIDGPQYKHVSDEIKKRWQFDERKLVRPNPKQNALCVCIDEEESAWLAERLNFAGRVSTLLRSKDWQQKVEGLMKLAKKAEEEQNIDHALLCFYSALEGLVEFAGLKEKIQ